MTGDLHPKKQRTAEKFGRRRFLSSAASFFAKKGGEDMKNIFKKALSFFLAVIMTVGMFPVTAMADGETEEYVYLSVSHDEKFIGTAEGSVAAHIPAIHLWKLAAFRRICRNSVIFYHIKHHIAS